MSVFASLSDAIFADPNLAEPAIWSPASGGGSIVTTVIVNEPDEVANFGTSRTLLATVIIEVASSAVASPAKGDQVQMLGQTYAIIASPVADADHLVWRCEAQVLGL